jgi:hypothetical protein
MRNTFLLLLFFASLRLIAQEPFYTTYHWEATPVPTPDNGFDQSEGQIVLKDFHVNEFVYEKSGTLVMYVTHHKLIRVFSDKGIEQNNKIYIPSGNVLEFMEIRARSISPTGKVSNIDKSAIKDAGNVENKGAFKMFAVESIEKNSEIEFIYTLKKPADFYGAEYLQSKVPKRNQEFEIICPKNLQYDMKMYNLDVTPVRDTLTGERNRITVKVEKLAPLKDEKYSMREANLARVEYKLAYNFFKGKSRVLTFEKAADVYYQSIFSTEKKDASAVKSLLKKLKITGSDEFSRVRSLEGKLKTKIEVKKISGAELEEIPKIIETNMANQTGIAKLYVSCLREMGLKVELVLICDRSRNKFDPDFDSWSYLEDILIYLPVSNTYLDPANILSRAGFIAPEYTGQKGLFVQEVDLGEVKSGIMKIKTIPYRDYEASSTSIRAEVTFPEDFSETSIQLRQTYIGYGAYSIQPIIGFLTDAQKKDFADESKSLSGENTVVDEVSMKGTAEEDILTNPFIVECRLKSPHLLEKAGNKYLFKVGTLLGPQVEMYQEGERKTTPEIYYAHSLKRELIIHIPAGYTCSNLENLKFNQRFMNGNDVLCEFISEYRLSEQTLTISIMEDYRVLQYPLAQFEKFRSVINASADFNKVAIILEKTGK